MNYQKKLIIFFLFFLTFFYFLFPQGFAEANFYEEVYKIQSAPKITAKSAIVFDKNTGKVIYGKDIHTKRSHGSISKLKTAIVAVDEGNLRDKVKVSSYAVSRGGTSSGLIAGERIIMADLIYAMILPSGNDGATAIAEHMAGTESAFVKMMNKKAKEIGAVNTSYNNPRGGMGSSPYDLALITSYAHDNEFLSKVLSTRSIEIPHPNSDEPRKYNNNNIAKLKRIFPEANGVKWGYIPASGHCLIGSAKRDSRYIIAVVMDSANHVEEVAALLEYGFEKTYIPVKSVTIDQKSKIVMKPGEYLYLTTTFTPDTASNKKVSWSSKNSTIATVNSSGRVFALNYGETMITVKTECGNKNTSVIVSVPYIPVESLALDHTEIEMATGETLNLNLSVYPDNASNKTVSWSTSDPNVATVSNNGSINVLDVGETVITVTSQCGEKTARCLVSVPYIEPEYLVINKSDLDLKLWGIGSIQRVTVEFYPPNTSYKDVIWHSGDSSIASVTDGLITAAGGGETVITVVAERYEDIIGNCSVTVTDDGIFYGDLNDDRQITVTDAIIILRHIVGLTVLDEEKLQAADVNFTGNVDVQDAILVLRFIVGLY